MDKIIKDILSNIMNMKIIKGKSDEWCGKHIKFNLKIENDILKNIETGEEEPNLIYPEDTIIEDISNNCEVIEDENPSFV